MSRIFYGLTDRSGVPSSSAWKDYGYDLDGLRSEDGDSNHCIPPGGHVRKDGTDGIDNAWGRRVMPTLKSLFFDLEELSNTLVSEGDFTYLLAGAGLGAQADYLGMEVRAYHGSPLATTPLFDGSESWAVTPGSLNGAEVSHAKWAFAEGYVADNVLVLRLRSRKTWS